MQPDMLRGGNAESFWLGQANGHESGLSCAFGHAASAEGKPVLSHFGYLAGLRRL